MLTEDVLTNDIFSNYSSLMYTPNKLEMYQAYPVCIFTDYPYFVNFPYFTDFQ